jgi:hypothetical protein
MAHVFISYSRYEVTFAESLARELERRGIEPWMDFRNLLPGRPWQTQLDEASESADAMMIVVSVESMKSAAVKDEWTKALAAKRRIILVIFEACVLPNELSKCEWVDYRTSFDKATDQLVATLKREPQAPTMPAPQTGRKLPPTPKLVTILTTIIAVNAAPGILVAIGAFIAMIAARNPKDTILDFVGAAVILGIPILITIRLLRLPYLITRRQHHYGDAQLALFGAVLLNPMWASIILFVIISAVIGFFGAATKGTMEVSGAVIVGSVSIGLLISVALVVLSWWLMRQNEGMHRWAGPKAMRIFNRSQLKGEKITSTVPFRPMAVTLAYDDVDEVIKDEIEQHLVKAGHQVEAVSVNSTATTQTPRPTSDNAIKLALLSKHNPSYETGEGSQLVIPMLVETADIPRSLSRLQWVDLRRGLPRKFGENFARLLPDPHTMIRAVGVIPSKQILVRPFQVNATIDSLKILAVFKVFWVVGLLLMWVSGIQMKTRAVFILGDLLVAFLGWQAYKGLQQRSTTQKRFIAYAVIILVVSWVLQVFGGFLLRPGETYISEAGEELIPISPAALLGSMGTLVIQFLPLLVLILALTPAMRRWLRKKPLPKLRSRDKVSAGIGAT